MNFFRNGNLQSVLNDMSVSSLINLVNEVARPFSPLFYDDQKESFCFYDGYGHLKKINERYAKDYLFEQLTITPDSIIIEYLQRNGQTI